MNILIPDIWLRTYLKTKATPLEIKEYLSLCGPSIERIYGEGNECVYDIEITGNRPDAMSVMGVAREAATILPRFGIPATLTGDPYREKVVFPQAKNDLKLTLKTDAELNPRWMSLIFDGVTVKTSPTWLTKYLELAGMRSLNNVVDITNFLMRAYGQPAHVFDYDAIEGHKMTLRASKKGEKLQTLDGKTHRLPGDDIVIEDKNGKLIDLCGIMGGENSSVTEHTKRVILFLQTYSPTHIRKTSMALGHRTEAAALFEKGLDTELVKPVFHKGMELMIELTGGKPASALIDLYPKPYKAVTVSVQLSKIHSYIGHISLKEIKETLAALGFRVQSTNKAITVVVPSFRRDVTIDVDVIEEIARVYGYQNIPSRLPEHAPPTTLPDPILSWEESVKVRLRDWGYTELITYSMVSKELMVAFGSDLEKTYKIANPLSSEWEYMRPDLFMSMVPVLRENLKLTKSLRVFELSMVYRFRPNDLPEEIPTLTVVWSGNRFLEAKGLAETIFSLFGIPFPLDLTNEAGQPLDWYSHHRLSLSEYGSLGTLDYRMLQQNGITTPLTRLVLDFGKLVARANARNTYTPVPKYPPIMEDLSFIVPDEFYVGPLMAALRAAHPLVFDVTLLDVHENTRTFHITYQDEKRNLTNADIAPVRTKLISLAESKFGLSLKSR